MTRLLRSVRRILRRVLEDAPRAGIVDELSAGYQALHHGNFAPRACAIRNLGQRRGGCIGLVDGGGRHG